MDPKYFKIKDVLVYKSLIIKKFKNYKEDIKWKQDNIDKKLFNIIKVKFQK